MKPILFNTEMVRGVDAGIKTVTRRVVKPSPAGYMVPDQRGRTPLACWVDNERWVKPPYRPGDILYVRETWCDPSGTGYPFLYKADMPMHWDAENTETGIPVDLLAEDYTWRPSIHMPTEAARLFLQVTGLRASRVQEITDEEARREGCADRADFHRVWNDCYAKPRPVKGEDGEIDHYESRPWEDIRETRTHKGKPWHVIGNPWVWVIEFKRITKEEALR